MPADTSLREYDTQSLATKMGTTRTRMSGRRAYTFGLKLDQPLSVTRLGYMNAWSETFPPFSIVPQWTIRGTADTSFFAGTGATNCNASNRCVLLNYAAEYWTPAWRRYYVPPNFSGTLLSDKADHTGQLFRRNRYYDPATGRFTQEDPIGLAGGMNLYGFASGDPVNFSDPFGLSPDSLDVDQSAKPQVDNCRAKSKACAEELSKLEKSTEYWEVEKGALPATCTSKGIVVGCTDPTPVKGHGKGGTITFNPADFAPTAKRIGLPINSVVVITHEAGHANGCTTEACAIKIENKARKDVGLPVRNP